MKTCSNCGADVPPEARICPQCSFPQKAGGGTPTNPTNNPTVSETTSPATTTSLQPVSEAEQVPAAPSTGVKQTEGLAVASMVCGILGIFTVPVVLSIVAIVLGRQSKRRIQQSGGTLEGEGLARAGIILGIVGLALVGIFILLMVLIASVALVSNASEIQSFSIL